MEEDIKQIKSSLEELETERDDIQLKCIRAELELSFENILKENENLKQAIEINKNLYQEVCNKNKELEKENQYYKKVIVEKEINENFQILYEKTLKAVKTDCIPKSLIKEKIEELDKRIKSNTTEEEYKKDKIYTCKDFNEFITSVLQELLRRKGEIRCVKVKKKNF